MVHHRGDGPPYDAVVHLAAEAWSRQRWYYGNLVADGWDPRTIDLTLLLDYVYARIIRDVPFRAREEVRAALDRAISEPWLVTEETWVWDPGSPDSGAGMMAGPRKPREIEP